MKLRKFLPQDVSVLNVINLGVSLLLILDLLVLPNVSPLTKFMGAQFWVIILLVVSLTNAFEIQLNRLTPLIVIIQWGYGLFFTWIAMSGYGISVSNSAMLVLGLSNFYAFTINASLLKDNLDGCPSTSSF